MAKYNKNVAALIIIICLFSVVIALFVPSTNKNQPKDFIGTKIKKNPCFQIEPINVKSPFKGEHISIIKLDGVISDSQSPSIFKDITSSNSFYDLLVKATKDPSVKAIVLRINSPGGTVAASQEIYKAVIKAKKKKPVVATMGDVAASGGYYIAAAADKIFANPGTLTGSIGVITSYLNFYGLLNKIGVQGVVIKSGEYKDIGNPTRPLSEQERKILQTLLDDTYDQFVIDVAKGRNIPREKVLPMAKGLIYTGKQAKKVGLIDFVGDYYQAIKYTQKLVKEKFPELKRKYGKKDIPIVETWKSISIFDVLLGAIYKAPTTNIIDNKLLKPYSYSRFQPLWLLE